MEPISVFDIFKIGIGPSSSHTIGPWRAAQRFLATCVERGLFDRIAHIRVDLFGSLAKTGRGHGTNIAILMGLSGEDPVTCDPAQVRPKADVIRRDHSLALNGSRPLCFDPAADLVFHPEITLPFHPNGLTFTATTDGGQNFTETYYSIGGGFLAQEGQVRETTEATSHVPFPFTSAEELLQHVREQDLTISQVVWRNELVWRDADTIRNGLMRIWETMRACVFRGCHTEGLLPGRLGVVRRAYGIHHKLIGSHPDRTISDWIESIEQSRAGFRETLEWVSCFALAVNEENADFGRVVTAPTNGAAGVIPAVLMYASCFGGATDEQVRDFLLTAGAIGMLFKAGATISAAMGGCQAEIGVSSAMAAAGLCQVLGGSADRTLMAAEIAMEHHLGLTCDPVGGLVQIPCIERNTMGTIKAITACHLALDGDPARAKVPLDAVIQTMWATAQDMNAKYKETSEGGLAVLIPVSLSEC